jgi:23S rRNA (uracil1939-C5)-methyltransferase
MNAPPSPEPRDILRLSFRDMAYGGDAVGTDSESGLTVFAWPGITGEEASVQVTSRRPKMLRGLVTEVHRASPHRTDAPCPYFGSCGGCQWQHMTYEAQVEAKHHILRSQLQRLGAIADPDPILRPPVLSPRPFGYRNTSQFVLDPATRKLSYHQRHGAELVAVDECPISNSGINRALPILNEMLVGALTEEELGIDRQGLMRVTRVVIRSSERTNMIVVVFFSGPDQPSRGRGGRKQEGVGDARGVNDPNLEVTEGRSPVMYLKRREVRRAIQTLRGDGDLGQIALLAVEVMSDGTTNLLGETRAAHGSAADLLAERYTGALLGDRESGGRQDPPLGSWTETLGQHTFWIAPEAFFQVNSEAAELMLSDVLEVVPSRLGLAVDAHAGVGTFALHIAARAQSVIGFETERPAVASANWTARAAGVTNIDYRVGRAEFAFPRLREDVRPDVVILDPPRAGCHPQLLAEIARRQAPLVVYVSCDPSTLARDVKILAGSEGKYILESARMYDLFPQTYHIETVAVLRLGV